MEEVLVIGGNGLLGSHTVNELLQKGYEVSTLALPRADGQQDVPLEVDAHWGNIDEMTDENLLDLFKDKYAIFWAIGADERTVPPAPAAAFFYEANVRPTQRIARLAREAGVKKFVLFGSYTAEFGELWPDLDYRGRNGYPRTRLLQEEVACMEGHGEMDVMTLRLPYIFGLVEGQRPLWQFVLDQVSNEEVSYVLPGSTSSVTVKQVAEAAVGAMENGVNEGKYPINAYSLSYKELYDLACEAIGKDKNSVQVVPLEAILPGYEQAEQQVEAAGLEHGVRIPDTARFQARDAVSPIDGCSELGIEDDDVVGSIREVFRWCVDNPVKVSD